ncbi:MMPL family transporter [Eubacteriaceae bacterium ES2]|nr:MMPL family transporter [Eubacteriaceae bacterium ES2]
MKKIAEFLVEKRLWVLVAALLITIGSGVLMQRVTIATDMTEYLPDGSSVKQGVEIIEDEFPDASVSNTIRVMFKGLTDNGKHTLKTDLEEIKYIDSVDYVQDDAEYNRDDYTLYVLNIPYDYGSDEMNAVESAVTENFRDTNNMIYEVNSSSEGDLPLWIVEFAFIVMMVILFLMCNSWVEPFLFLAMIVMAIIINKGTNLFLGSVSEITDSISAILQLVLSMDYAIILMNRYRQELKKYSNRTEAMKKAVLGAFSSITSSSLTTIVGLLMLSFMSFKIGADLGIVLAKGVLISLLCVFAVLPSLILLFNKWIDKTAKKVLNIPMEKVGKFSYQFKYVISGVFVVIFVAMFLLKGSTSIRFCMASANEVNEIFPKANKVVVIYDNQDEDTIQELIPEIEEKEGIDQVTTYVNTLGKRYTAAEMDENLPKLGSSMSIDSGMINLIYYEYYGNGEKPSIKLSNFLAFMENDIAKNAMFSDKLDDSMKTQLEMLKPFSSSEALQITRSSEEISQLFGIEPAIMEQIFAMSGSESMSIVELLQMMSANSTTLSANMDESAIAKMQMLKIIITGVMQEQEYSAEEMTQLFTGSAIDESTMELLYTLYESEKMADGNFTLTIPEMLEFTMNTLAVDDKYKALINEDTLNTLAEANEEVENAASQLIGENYSMMVISSSMAEGTDEINAFLDDLSDQFDQHLTGDYYLVGNSPMSYEMSKTFDDELNKITILTMLAIFLVVLITFKNALIPAILVALIQTAVYMTMIVMNLSGSGIYYLALLIAQSILMGATIDYGILYTSYYREKRQTMNVRESVTAAYQGSIHTILTSGMIMTIVTAIVGFAFDDLAVRQIVQAISKGAACSILLIVFILPGILAACDRFICKRKQVAESQDGIDKESDLFIETTEIEKF